MFKKISNLEFATILKKAVNGDQESIYKIINIYEPLINKFSKINGRFNQECKDYIIDNIFKYIRKFEKI